MPPVERSRRSTEASRPEGFLRRNLGRVANGAMLLGGAAAVLGGGTAALFAGDNVQPNPNDWRPLLSNVQGPLRGSPDVLENLVWNPGLQRPLTTAEERGAARAASTAPNHLELGTDEVYRGKRKPADVYEAVALPGARTLYILKNGSTVDGFQVEVPSDARIREIAQGQLEQRAFREGLVDNGLRTAEVGTALFLAGAAARRRSR